MHECLYCTRGEELDRYMLEICALQVSTLYLHKEQTYTGRCVVALNEHVREIFHLTPEKRALFIEDVAKVAQALEKAFLPDKLNYGIFGDNVPHLHVHIVPKYKEEGTWGKPFELHPANKRFLTDEEYQAIIEKIVRHLD